MKTLFSLLFVLGLSLSFAQEQFDSFVYAENIDAMTDMDTSFIYTIETDAVGYREGSLIWICAQDGLLRLGVNADEFLDSDDTTLVSYRFDKGTPETAILTLVPEGTGAYATGSTLEKMTAAALAASTMVVRFEDYRGSDYTYIFSLTGLSDALGKLGCAAEYLP